MTPTQPQMAALLAELTALERAAAVITNRADLSDVYTWRCVLVAIRDRRVKLLEHAEAQLSEPVNRDAESGTTHHFTADVPPPGRVH